ncbi:MAG: TetR/AcrR family transcriptional regulator [Acidobacteria bacterium]|nr:TetR/AcrR family transcriptional regulator [Candidatus Sulfomarinibacter sp. MAG AM1]
MISTVTTRGDKRLRLVTAATAVFAEKGYASTRVADIAERAGVGKGTVYEYFSSKEELLFAVFESINADISSRMNDALAAGGSSEEQLHNLLRLGAEVISEQVDLQPVILDFWAASRGKDFEETYRRAVVASYSLFRNLVSDFIREEQNRGGFKTSVDAESLAAVVVATVDGLGIQLFFDRSINPNRITEAFASLLYESLTTETP